MKILSTESFKKIEPIIPMSENYSNVHARLRQRLTTEESEFFARPDFPVPNMGSWTTDVNVPMRSYADADDMDKAQIAQYIEDMKGRILPKLTEMKYAESLFCVPSEKQIHWYRDAGDTLHVVLDQWGFKYFRQSKSENIIDIILCMPRNIEQEDIRVRIIYSDDMPATGAVFTLHILNNEKKITTDDAGVYNIGKIYAGKTFSVSDERGKRVDFEVEKGKSEYQAQFDLYTSYTVKVVNQYDEPLTGFELSVDDADMTTDDNGMVCCDDILLTNGRQLNVYSSKGGSCTYVLQRDAEQNNFIYKIEEVVRTSFTVTVVDQNEKPVPNYEIDIDGISATTNESGMVSMTDYIYVEGKKIHVSSPEGGEQIYELSLDKTENDFVYRINQETPVPEPEPEPEMVRIRILDYDGSPLDNIMVHIDIKKGETLSAMSDEEGYATFPASSFTDNKKAKVRFVVPKEYREKKNNEKREQNKTK